MTDYLHGAYGNIRTAGSKTAMGSDSAFVYVGTAPVHNVANGADNVNKPVLVNNIAEARAKFGYSDDWASYTLCEAMHNHLVRRGVGPLVLINVLDPATHKAAEQGSVSLTPENGRITIVNAESIILDSLTIEGKTAGTDYTAAYDFKKKSITIQEIAAGGLGSAAVTITYGSVDATAVDETDVIGSTDNAGLNKGLYAIRNVYQLTHLIPSFLAAPGFSGIPAVHSVMSQVSKKINNHWDAYVFCDIPIVDSNNEAITLDTAATWKNANGYNKPGETVYFPMGEGTDGKKYHLSTLAAANLQALIAEQDGIPYKSASNTDCEILCNLYLGDNQKGRVFDDNLINEKLNKNGIASAAFTGGRWAIWGAHSADYNQQNGDQVNVAETNYMMLYYISNDFQARRPLDVDKPLTMNDIRSIVAEERLRLDALIKIGALVYGNVDLNASADAASDIMNGDYQFSFAVTTTPLAKSLTADVAWTEDGFVTYFDSILGSDVMP